jgi:hypothetical protein
MSIVISDVITEYGSYYLDHGQNATDLFKKLYRPSVTASYFKARPTKETVYRVGSADLDRVLQPFQKQFTPIGTLSFKPNPINLYQLKIDKQEYPDDIADSWLGFLEGEGIDRQAWPFVRWMLEEHIIPKAIEDHELNEAWAGVFAAPTPGTAGAAGTAMNGIKKQIADYVTAGRSTTIVMGAVPVDDEDFCTYVETYVKSHPKEIRKKLDFVFMSEDLFLRYKEGKRQKYNLQYQQTSDLETVFHFPHVKVAQLPSMGTSNKLWSTLPQNRIRPIKKAAAQNAPIIKEFSPRAVSIFTDWWEVLGFPYPEFVFQTDQA